MARIGFDRARRIALAAQGFTDPPPGGRVDVRHFRRVMRRVGLVQLDSVNVFSRTHYLPFFSRLGPYDRAALDEWLWSSGEVFEYWGHEASVMPVDRFGLFTHRMTPDSGWRRMQRMREERPEFIEAVLQQVRERGPLTTSDLTEPGERDATQMWGWSDGKVALEALFAEGRVTTAGRPNFVRHYDVTERVFPGVVVDEDLDPDEARIELLRLAARSCGVGTAADLADYHRLTVPISRPLLARLVEAGELEQVEVEGWDRPAYLDPAAVTPRAVEGSTLLSPFDSLVWFRPRVERIWHFHYRIEIYVPAHKRVHGYYVLPYLLDGRLVARVDLKTDRSSGRLLVRAAFGEGGIDRPRVASALATDLGLAAEWLGVTDVVVEHKGDLAGPLATALG
jgi:uncharacterized protein